LGYLEAVAMLVVDFKHKTPQSLQLYYRDCLLFLIYSGGFSAYRHDWILIKPRLFYGGNSKELDILIFIITNFLENFTTFILTTAVDAIGYIRDPRSASGADGDDERLSTFQSLTKWTRDVDYTADCGFC
jgi:hypothetical protein